MHFSARRISTWFGVVACLMVSLYCVAGPATDKAADAKPVKTLKVLAIGNSFSGNATTFLHGIVKESPDHELIFGHAMIGGCPLDKHYNLAMKHEKNPDDPAGKPYGGRGKKKSLKEMLESQKWDIVTIQQLSIKSFKPETYRPYAQNMCDYIKKYAPQAEIVFHQTWPYRADDSLFKKDYSREKMYQDLTKAYHTIAKEVGIKRIIPVGDAFKLANEAPEWQFETDKDFDYKNPVYPNLPKQAHSLNAGYMWRKNRKKPDEKPKFAYDGHHANRAGQYLGACVWFEYLFGGDATKITFKPKEVSAEDAAFLRGIAHKLVTEGVKPKAWPLAQ